MTNTDDVWTVGDKYTWTKGSEVLLQNFLTKYKPSMVQNDGTKPWIWVQGSDSSSSRDANQPEAQKEAEVLLKETTEKVKEIQDDPSIPMRSNKKTGVRSKKELREGVQMEATAKLKEIAVKHSYVAGKWLIFVPADKVDVVWSNIATSLVSGPLSSTVAWLAKVATSPERETPNYQHIICVYVPNVFDKDGVLEVARTAKLIATQVMKVLLRNHGTSLSGVKADLYTAVGIDSKHPSGVPSTVCQSNVWKNTALLKDTEIKALREEFFENLNKEKASVSAASAEKGPEVAPSNGQEADNDTAKAKPIAKPKLKKEVKDDFFASDEDQDVGEEKKRKAELKSKKTTAPAKRAKPSVAEDNDEDEEDRASKPKKARTTRE
ncbi:hypothetical protein AN958_11390 [Leucoagaricus sp. SymC.cos]|nr:hypothetical protein AN958_11390 [Leucoagaricus sp. SymC.cos]